MLCKFENHHQGDLSGDTIQLAPPFISSRSEIDSLINALGETFNGIN